MGRNGLKMGIAVVASVGAIAIGGWAQKDGGKSKGTTAERISRVEKGIEPIHAGKGEAKTLDVDGLMKMMNDPALSVAVIDGYKVVWAKAYGTTELGGGTAVTTKTLFQAGSISKPVAATGMLALVQTGKLSLDEDVNVKLKSWKVPENEFTKDQKVTLRRIASHTAGLTVHGFPGYAVDEKMPTVVQVLNGEKPANTEPIRVDFVPGTQERYSGGGVTIEQLVMTDVTGEAFPALMKKLVIDKIGMSDSSYEQPLPAAWAARTPTGTDADGKPVHGKWHVYPEMAAAGLWTTPTDLAKFAIEIALARQGKSNKVLTQKTVEEMLTAQPSTDGTGIGFAVPKERPGEFGHNGADEGFQALLVMNWETGQGAALMANSDNGILVMNEMMRSVAKEYGWKYAKARGMFEEFMLIAKTAGTEAVLARYDELKNSGDEKKRPPEFVLNATGYMALREGKKEEAIRLFERNVQEYPESSNVYDSLGEAYAAAGKKELAIENYEKAVKLDPKNENAKEWLKKLRKE
ncbi:MAG TPA: serine hydrolase [Candidatus Acidoferrum sp.]|nr:serine hydrolase [Candidatus Acidoferrum sp.]